MSRSTYLLAGIALAMAGACTYEPAHDLTCDPGESADGRTCVGGVWVSDGSDLDGAVPPDEGGGGGDANAPDMPSGQDTSTPPDMPVDMPECVPETDVELCAGAGAECGAIMATDRCGVTRTSSCGACTAPEICGTDNTCSCTPETAAQFCTRLGKDCDMVTAPDNCGDEQTYNCGTCEAGITCGEEQPNVCGCPCNIAGTCYPEGAPNPANPCEVCDSAASPTGWTVAVGSQCDDGNPCTVGDACSAAGACDAAPKDCSCGAPGTTHCAGLESQCHTGMCDALTGNCIAMAVPDQTACTSDAFTCTNDACVGGNCIAEIDAGACLINGMCYAANDTNGPCEKCDPAQNQQTWTISVGATCTTDSLTCTTETCSASGQCVAAIDGGSCLVNGFCFDDGDPSPVGTCSECDAGTSQTNFSPSTGTSCDDMRSCTQGDVCQNGTCTYASISNGRCFIQDSCFNDGQFAPGSTCRMCDAGNDQTNWTIAPTTCSIGGVCYSDGDPNPANPCQACDSAQSQTSFTDLDTGVCGSGCSCSMGRCLKNSNQTPCGGP